MEERKEQVRRLMQNLSARFREHGIHPEDKVPSRWLALNEMCASYIQMGRPAWEIIEDVSRGIFCDIFK